MRRLGVLVAVLAFGLVGAQSALAAGGSWSSVAPLPASGNGTAGAVAAPVASSSGTVGADVLVVLPYGSTEIYDPGANSWTQTAALPDERELAVAAPLSNGNVLVTSGYDSNGPTGDTEIYHPSTDTWTQAAPLPDPRYAAVAATLGNGDVLVTSGYDANGVTGDTELYNPATNTWTRTGALPDPRENAVAASLGNGDVLVSSGADANGFTGDTEIYHPSTNTWAQAAPLPDPRENAVAASLGNGNAFVTSGDDTNGTTGDTELYDAVTNTWTQSPALPDPRYFAIAAELPNGGVLVTAGIDDNGDTSDSEVFSLDPTQTSVSCMPGSVPVYQASTCTATVTDTASSPSNPSGTVSFTANQAPSSFAGNPCTLAPVAGSSSTSSCQVRFTPGLGDSQDTVTGSYQPAGGYAASQGPSTPIAVSAVGGSWSNAAPLPGGDADGAAAAPVASPSGTIGANVLIAKQYGPTEVYDPSTNSWTQSATLPDPREDAVAAPLSNGDVLVTSGFTNAVTGDTEIYNPSANTWTQAATLPDPRYGAVAAPLPNGDVLVTSGYQSLNPTSVTGDTELYNPSTNTWTQAATLPDARGDAVAASLGNGDVLVTSGSDSNGLTGDTELYNPSTNTWIKTASLPDPRQRAVATALSDGNALVTSGDDDNGSVADTELYDPVTNTWTQSAALPDPRYGAVAAELPDGRALVSGGLNDDGLSLSDSEVFSLDQTQTSVSCTPGAVLADQATTCTATVTDIASEPANPSGTVKFMANRVPSSFAGNPCTLAPVSGSSSQSSCQVSFTPALGQTKATVTGYYQPAGGFASGHGSSAPIMVSARKSTTSLSCPSSTPLNQAVECTVTVSDASQAGQPQPPTGTVTFAGKTAGDQFSPAYSCTLTPGSGASSSCEVDYRPTTGVGKHVISARYRGDTAYQGGTSNTTVIATSTTAN